jgi:hypothetical protein
MLVALEKASSCRGKGRLPGEQEGERGEGGIFVRSGGTRFRVQRKRSSLPR